MGSRGASANNAQIKTPESYRGPSEFGEAFARLNPKLSPEQVADRAVDAYNRAEDYMTGMGDLDGVYDAAYTYAGKKRGMSEQDIRLNIQKALDRTGR